MKITKEFLQSQYGEKGTIFTLKEFIEYVEIGAFNDRQGKATFLDSNGIEYRNTPCGCDVSLLKKFRFKFKFILWVNNR
jgi:hypothetical protein